MSEPLAVQRTERPTLPSHSPACHPNASWCGQEHSDEAVCSLCGRTDEEQKRGGFQITAGNDLGTPPDLHESKDQLYRAILAIVLETDDVEMKERMLHWQHLSSAFWHYQHVLWADAKAANYWSPKWQQQRAFALDQIAKRSGKPSPRGENDSLTLSDLGL